ncbi:MAG: hypothetical protein QOE68_3571, partial [Thermoanaerobaculia bacterium]|nr:hypothetical protein [Thermoanaerobaculia bacterium]
GGALYPLELYVHATNVTGLPKGLYHFDARAERLRAMNDGDLTAKIASALVQPEIALHAAAIVFITALFERSSFKYSERAYRFALIEAGHVGQNLDLAAVGLGLTALNVGGYYDHEVDELLGLDGVDHSTIYLTAIGRDDAP